MPAPAPLFWSQDNLSSIDILSACNLVNYFGKMDLGGSGVGQITIHPILIRKVDYSAKNLPHWSCFPSNGVGSGATTNIWESSRDFLPPNSLLSHMPTHGNYAKPPREGLPLNLVGHLWIYTHATLVMDLTLIFFLVFSVPLRSRGQLQWPCMGLGT